MTNKQRMLRDAALQVTKALPADASTIYTAGLDLEHDATGVFVADCELLIESPALAVADLANGETMTYKVQHADESDFSDAEDLADAVLVQTGADGAGAAAAETRFHFPSTVKRHVRVGATNSGAGDASDKSLTAGLVF
jgi:hypothetical protein